MRGSGFPTIAKNKLDASQIERAGSVALNSTFKGSVRWRHDDIIKASRATVTVAAGELQRAGLIGYSRGKIHILDRPRLGTTACECYRIVSASYGRVLRRNGDNFLAYVD